VSDHGGVRFGPIPGAHGGARISPLLRASVMSSGGATAEGSRVTLALVVVHRDIDSPPPEIEVQRGGQERDRGEGLKQSEITRGV